MISIPAVRVLLATRPVDFRKKPHGLAALASEVLGDDPFSGAVIVFRSKRADRIKTLVWDGSGLVLDGLDWTRVQATKRIATPSAVAWNGRRAARRF